MQAIAQSLKALAQRNQDTQLAEITTALVVLVVGCSWQLQSDSESFTLTTQAYADKQGISQRYAQRLCRNHKVPAILADDGTWRIRQ